MRNVAADRGEGLFFLARLRAERVDDTAEQVGDAENLGRKPQAAGLDLRNVENVADELAEVAAGQANLEQSVALAHRVVYALLRDLGKAEQGVERRADVVRDAREKVCFGGARAVRFLRDDVPVALAQDKVARQAVCVQHVGRAAVFVALFDEKAADMPFAARRAVFKGNRVRVGEPVGQGGQIAELVCAIEKFGRGDVLGSRSWEEKGVPFFEPLHGQDPRRRGITMKLYRITREQLEKVQKQEGASDDWYGMMYCLELDKDGTPVVTLTSRTVQAENAPCDAILETMYLGMTTCCGRGKTDTVNYLKHSLPQSARRHFMELTRTEKFPAPSRKRR